MPEHLEWELLLHKIINKQKPISSFQKQLIKKICVLKKGFKYKAYFIIDKINFQLFIGIF